MCDVLPDCYRKINITGNIPFTNQQNKVKQINFVEPSHLQLFDVRYLEFSRSGLSD